MKKPLFCQIQIPFMLCCKSTREEEALELLGAARAQGIKEELPKSTGGACPYPTQRFQKLLFLSASPFYSNSAALNQYLFSFFPVRNHSLRADI